MSSSRSIPTEECPLPTSNKRYASTKRLSFNSYLLLKILNDDPDEEFGFSKRKSRQFVDDLLWDAFKFPHKVSSGTKLLSDLEQRKLIRLEKTNDTTIVSLTNLGKRAANDPKKYASSAINIYLLMFEQGAIRETDDKNIYEVASELSGMTEGQIKHGIKRCKEEGLIRLNKRRGTGRIKYSSMTLVDHSPTTTPEPSEAPQEEPRYAPSNAFILASQSSSEAPKSDMNGTSDYAKNLVALFEASVQAAAREIASHMHSDETVEKILEIIDQAINGNMSPLLALVEIEAIANDHMKSTKHTTSTATTT